MREATHSRQSMRALLALLRQSGQLLTVTQPVALDFELAGCLVESRDGPALQFSSVSAAGGRPQMPLVGNLLNSLPRFAAGLGCAVDQLQARLVAAIEAPIPHRLVTAAPCQQEIVVDPVLSD